MLNFNEELIRKNKDTEIFSAIVAPDMMAASLARNKKHIEDLARIINDYNPDVLLFTGSGASYCTLYTGYYFMKANSKLSVKHDFGPTIELEHDKYFEELLEKKKVFAIIASYSGKTADTVSVSNYLKSKGVPRIALSKDSNGPLAQGCDYVLAYEDKCLYTSAMANLLSLLSNLMVLRGEYDPANKMFDALEKLPSQMKEVLKKSEELAKSVLESVKDDDFFYVVGDGALWALAYQLGYTNLTEYSRVHAGCIRACEWRHGSLEILFRKPAMIHLIGNDKTREYSLATKVYCETHGAKVITFDVNDYFKTLPELAPFVLHAVIQYFFMFQSTSRGIFMDDYLQMHVVPYKPGETYF